MRRIFTKKEQRTDEELLQLYFNNKEERVLGILYGRYIEKIFGTCRYFINHFQDAEDAAMEVLEILTIELGKTPKINNFKDWVFIITRNYCFRKNKGKSKVLALFEQINEKTDTLFVYNQDETTLYNEMECLYECVDKALKELTPIQQTCIDLFYLKEKGYKEIARELAITTDAVRSNIQNGRRNLRNKLNK